MIVGINIFKSIIYSMSSSKVVDIMNYLAYGLSTTFYNFINQIFPFLHNFMGGCFNDIYNGKWG